MSQYPNPNYCPQVAQSGNSMSQYPNPNCYPQAAQGVNAMSQYPNPNCCPQVAQSGNNCGSPRQARRVPMSQYPNPNYCPQVAQSGNSGGSPRQARRVPMSQYPNPNCWPQVAQSGNSMSQYPNPNYCPQVAQSGNSCGSPRQARRVPMSQYPNPNCYPQVAQSGNSWGSPQQERGVPCGSPRQSRRVPGVSPQRNRSRTRPRSPQMTRSSPYSRRDFSPHTTRWPITEVETVVEGPIVINIVSEESEQESTHQDPDPPPPNDPEPTPPNDPEPTPPNDPEPTPTNQSDDGAGRGSDTDTHADDYWPATPIQPPDAAQDSPEWWRPVPLSANDPLYGKGKGMHYPNITEEPTVLGPSPDPAWFAPQPTSSAPDPYGYDYNCKSNSTENRLRELEKAVCELGNCRYGFCNKGVPGRTRGQRDNFSFKRTTKRK